MKRNKEKKAAAEKAAGDNTEVSMGYIRMPYHILTCQSINTGRNHRA